MFNQKKTQNKGRKKKMKNTKNKIAAIAISIVMIFIMGSSAMMAPSAHAQTTGSVLVPTLAYCNVAPNPCGVGQIVTIGFWLADPMFDSEHAKGLQVFVTTPAGVTSTLGNFTADLTGGTFTTYTPSTVGNYTFWMVYGGQQYTGTSSIYYNQGSTSEKTTLLVTNEPRGGLPDTPLPTNYWQTPVNAENVQLWSAITGSWLGFAANTFAATGGYNFTGNYNPYTQTPKSAHILWTKQYCGGGVAGGELGGSEQFSSYWVTSQYEPKYAPVIINGVEYSTWYTSSTSSKQGIIAIDLFSGKTLWVINTTSTLRCGMVTDFENINQYGVTGPFIITTGALLASETGGMAPSWHNTGTEFNIYDGLTGQFLCAVVNGSAPGYLGEDAHGNIIGYGTNSTAGSMTVTWAGTALLGTVTTTHTFVVNSTLGPNLYLWNLSLALNFNAAFNFGFSLNQAFLWKNGVMWSNPMGAYLNGALVSGLTGGGFGFSVWGQNTIVTSTGTVSVAEQRGYQVEAGFSTKDGHMEWIYNRTSADTPMLNPAYTRLSNTPSLADGIYVEINQNSYVAEGFNVDTGKSVWTSNLNVPMADGNMPNPYDSFDFETVPDATSGVLYVWALGGDVWALNITNGAIIWSWSTYQLHGPAGTESPYGTYPLWVFSDEALAGQGANTVLYLSEGHEYDPPLFHGAHELAFDGNTGKLLWSNLGFDDTATAVAYGVMTTINAYDGQVYAYAQGPSKTTVNAPSVGVTTKTPITISGTVTDISAGASQPAVAANFPNGLPCVSDDSMSGLMEAAYEQQPMPHNLTGVPVNIYVLDSNNNYRSIGTTTSDASGTYGLTWTPDIAGNYTVYAVFAGTNGYYGSAATAHFFAGSPEPTAAPTATPLSGVATQSTLMYIGIAIIIVIVIIGAVLAILVTRKHP
jgi:hypothetical protein